MDISEELYVKYVYKTINMGFLKALWNWNKRIKNSDIKYIKVTDNGSFYMSSEDLFNDKKEALELLKKLNEAVDKRKKVTDYGR